MTSPRRLTPQERLAISREAMLRHMAPHNGRNAEHAADAFDAEDVTGASSSKWRIFKRGILGWWYHHPASVALDVARPLIGKFAQGHPFQLLGIAAGLGAAAVFFKPWRLISLGGVLLATMKSSDLTGMVLSMFTPGPQPTDLPRETQ